MNRKKLIWRLVPLMAMMTLLLTGCGMDNLSALKPKGPVAQEQLFLIMLSLGIMLFVFAVVMVIYVYVLIRYRKKPGDNSIPKQVEGNHKLEVLWTTIPIILLIILAVPTIQYTFKHSEDFRNSEDALHIKVTGHQFWWEFEYPNEGGLRVAQDLYIPAGKQIAFELTASDVIHSFWIPALGGKVDTNPGLTTVLPLVADEPGLYFGKCAELCGASHALMDFKVIALPEDEYNAWVQDMKTPVANALTGDEAAGQELFQANCISCHALEADGFSSGPNLNGFADRTRVAGVLEHTDEKVFDWIQRPKQLKEGARMPNFGKDYEGGTLDDNQINQVVKYLNTLTIKK